MSQITGGKVLFGRTLKTGDYENKRVDVEIAFSVGDGESHDAILNTAAGVAHGKAHEMLGIKAPSPSLAAAGGTAPAVPPNVIVETAGPAEAAAKTGAKTTRKPAKPPADPAAVDVVGEQKPAASTIAASAGATVAASAPGGASSADPAAVDDELFSAAPAEVTDEALMSAITKKNAEIKNPGAIRALIGKYVPAPKQAREIDQAKRSAFLKELETLQKAA